MNPERHMNYTKPPKHSEKTRMCRQCGFRTTFVYDHGVDMFICSEHEL